MTKLILEGKATAGVSGWVSLRGYSDSLDSIIKKVFFHTVFVDPSEDDYEWRRSYVASRKTLRITIEEIEDDYSDETTTD